jgi:preprotein translocase subunit SecD
MNSSGAKKFSEITKNNIGRLLAVVLDDRVLMAPMINMQIVGGNGSITGQFSVQEVQDLSILLRSGSLPAKISIINERSLSSVFDGNMLSKAAISAVVSLFVVAVILNLRYRVLGMIAVLVLLLNLLFIIMIISVFGFTLTLPGIAGLILTLGMATDANILIYERIKELKKQGINDTRTIIKNSFSKSFNTILDSNITTILAGITLFSFGGSFIKGFSVTLIIGILCSLFTAVKITKIIIERVYCKRVY